MRGILIHYNHETDQGLIRAEDSRRYAFLGNEWRADTQPIVGDEVDFEAEGSTAYDVYLLKAAGAQVTARQAHAGAGPVAQGLPEPHSNEAGRRPYAAAIIALVTLAGCLIPYLSFGGQSVSLFGVAPAISDALDGMAQLERLGRVMGGPRPAAGAPDLAAIKWTLGFGYILYLVPLLSIVVIAFTFLNRRVRRMAFWHALSSIVLPIVVPFGVAMAVYEQIPPEMRRAMSSNPLNPDFSFTGFGFWVIVLSGVAQFLNWLFFRKKWAYAAAGKIPVTS